MKKIIVPFSSPTINDKDIEDVKDALSTRWLTNGMKLKKFEQDTSKYVKTKYSIATSSCSTALHTVIRSLGIKDGDEVIIPTLTFAATANAVIHCGGRVVFTEIEEKNIGLDPNEVINNITSKTKAIIAVHFGGKACEITQLEKISKEHNIHLIEDCAHSLGATLNGRMTGSFGDAGCFSFYPTKIMTTCEGGIITTNNEEIANKSRLLINHAISENAFDREESGNIEYDVIDIGYNYRMNEIQASLGISQLAQINQFIKMRKNAARIYDDGFNGQELTLMSEDSKRNNNHYLYMIRLKEQFGVKRNELAKKLREKGIGTSLHYKPLHLMSAYRKYCESNKKFEISEQIYKDSLCLPMFPGITKKQQEYVIESMIKK